MCVDRESVDFRFRLLMEPLIGDEPVAEVCRRNNASRKTWYKWRRRYEAGGVKGLENRSRKPCTIQRKVTPSHEQLILQLRAEKLGPRRIKHRLRRRYGVDYSTRTIYKTLKRNGCNLLHPPENRTYKRFERAKPNELIQMDIFGPFYLKGSRKKNYVIHCLDDHSRKVVSRWTERKRSREAIATLNEWISRHGRPDAVASDNGKQFTSKAFIGYLTEKNIRHIRISPSHPQTIGKIEAFNKTVKREFLKAEPISNPEEGKVKYQQFIDDYNSEREHTSLNGQTPNERFHQTLNAMTTQTTPAQKVSPINVTQTVTHVCKPNS